MAVGRVLGDVYRIRLDNEEFEGRNNAYLLVGDGPTTLVDTGVATNDVRRQLETGLSDVGVEVADVEVVVLTHWHYDHAGLAGHVQAVSGATVYAHEADLPIIEGDAFAEILPNHHGRLDEWGVPPDEQAVIRETTERSVDLAGEPVNVEPVVDGEVLDAGGDRLRVLHTPGHTAGLVSLVVEDRDEALVGDTILPVYTPNVGGADLRVDRPLATYRASLRRIADAEFDCLYPGHRNPIDDPNARVEAILQHHRERTHRIVDVLDEHGPSTVWEVSAVLFGDLSGIHVLHGPGEAYAHLDELEATGQVEHVGRRYRLPAGSEGAR